MHGPGPKMHNRGLICIIGGGPSAAVVDTARLKPAFVLGVNDAAFHKPCDAFFSNDHKYALRIAKAIEAFPGECHLSIKPEHLARFRKWSAATVWTRAFSNVPSTAPGVLASGGATVPGCSGYVALNLAAQMGAKRIILFGYDFDDVYRYFFSASPFPRIKIPGVIASFRKVAPWYREHGIEVLNANSRSQVDAFPTITHAEAYAIAAAHQGS